MKEIIYLDTEIINSMLAQLDEGIINSFTLENISQETQGEEVQSGRGKEAKLKGNVTLSTGILPGGSIKFGTDLGNSGTETEKYSSSILEGQKDILNKAFHDHALEILLNKLIENNLLMQFGESNEGDLLFIESSFRYYDFELLKNSADAEIIQSLISFDQTGRLPTYEEASKLVKQKNIPKNSNDYLNAKNVVDKYNDMKPIINIIEAFHSLGNYTSKMLQNQAIVKAGKNIGIIKNKYLRESPEALVFRTDTSREAKILLRVIGNKNKVFNGKNMALLNEQDLDKIPNMMLDVILGSFNIIQAGDVLVTPIAIYFE